MGKVFLSLLLLVSSFAFSQRGKDGAGNITTANTIVNIYTDLTSSASSGNTTINVTNTTGFSAGDLIFIIQMQGASVNAGKDTIWPDFNSSIPTNTTYGAVTNYGSCGDYEYVQVRSVSGANQIVLDCGLAKNYNYLGKVQVIRVPRYTTLIVSGAGSITSPSWNGTTGGVVAVEVAATTTLSSAPSINVTGTGFRGGAALTTTLAYVGGGNKFGHVSPTEGGEKGESIAGDFTRYASVFSGRYGRGAFANGGGGGCTHNAGGGGGANGGNLATYNGRGNPVAGYNNAWNLESAGFSTSTSSGGGRGGYTHSGNNQNPNTLAPGSGTWGGDGRRVMGGYGGRPLDYSTGKLFLGGGGGAGHANNGLGGNGGSGGGLVFMLCYGNVSGAGTIVADGANATNPASICSDADGSHGGGGGGTIVLSSAGTINLTAATALSARGGNGGNVTPSCGAINSNGYGPGAGGGGGYISSTGTLPSNNVSGGNNGVFTTYVNQITNNFPPNGATRGGAGGTGASSIYTLTASNATICANNTASLTASSSNGAASIVWFDAPIAGNIIGTGSPFTTSVIATAGTYSVWAGSCPGSYRVPSEITVTNGPTVTINTPTICAGSSTVLTAGGAVSYTWSTGPSTATISVSPTVTTVYTVTADGGGCLANKTTTVTVNAAPSITVNPQAICSGSTAILTASGASTYTWSTGPMTTTISVSPTVTTNYTVTGTSGGCSSSQITTVTVNATPTITASSATICAGQTATLSGGGATSYTWSSGPLTTSITVSPTITTNYTLTGSNGTCSNTATTSVNVNSLPTVTASSATICTGQTATLSGGGATSYTWSSGPLTTSITVSPTITTNYTLTGSNGICSNTATTSVNVNSLPTVTASTATICAGQTATLSGGGATSYTWSSGPMTTSITVSPTITTNYTVTGTNGTCSNTATTSVNVNGLPTVTATSATICPGGTGTLTANGASTYTWSPGSIAGASFTASPGANSVYTVTGTSVAGCINTTTASINVGSAISISVNSATLCTGQSATLTATGATSYTWSTGAFTSSIVVTPATNTSYTINGSSSGCSGTQTTNVDVNPIPSVSSASVAICSGQTATLTATGATTYTWMPGNLTGTSVTVSPVATQIYTVSGASLNCASTATTSVDVTDVPSLVASSQTVCTGQTATLVANGASSYTWNPGGLTGATFTTAPAANSTYTVLGANGSCTAAVTVSVDIGTALSITVNNATVCAGQSATLTASGSATSFTWSTGASSNSIVVTPTASASYTVDGSAGGCLGTGTGSIAVNAVPSLTVSGSAICSGQTATLTVAGATTYTWMPGNSTASTFTDAPSVSTTYSVAGDISGCATMATVDVTVTPTPTLTVNSPTICGGSATLTASGASNYTWTPGGSTSPFIVVTPTATTTYSLDGANGTCLSNLTTSVTLSSAPPLTIASDRSSDCAGACLSFSSSVAGYNSLVFDYGDGVSSSTLTTHCYSVSGTYTVSAVGIYTTGCSMNSMNALTVTINSSPVASFTTGSAPFYINTAVNFTNTSLGASNNYAWTFGDGSSSFSVNPTNTYANAGNYCVMLVATDAITSCKDSVTQCIDILAPESINIPNVFTPNNDGVNEVFKITGTGIKEFHCSIFDRWGLKMYEWDGIGGGWDGRTTSGVAVPAGTYFYVISYAHPDGTSESVTGYLMLFKE